MRILVEKTDTGVHIHASNEFYIVEDVLQRASIDIAIKDDSPVVEVCVCDQNFGDWLGGPELDFFDVFEVKMSKEKDQLLQAVQLIEKMLDRNVGLVIFDWQNPIDFNEELTVKLEKWGFAVDKPNPLLPF